MILNKNLKITLCIKLYSIMDKTVSYWGRNNTAYDYEIIKVTETGDDTLIEKCNLVRISNDKPSVNGGNPNFDELYINPTDTTIMKDKVWKVTLIPRFGWRFADKHGIYHQIRDINKVIYVFPKNYEIFAKVK